MRIMEPVTSSSAFIPQSAVVADKAYMRTGFVTMRTGFVAKSKRRARSPTFSTGPNSVPRHRFKKALHRERNLIERFFNHAKYYQQVATRCEKLGAKFLGMVKVTATRVGFGK